MMEPELAAVAPAGLIYREVRDGLLSGAAPLQRVHETVRRFLLPIEPALHQVPR